MGRCPWYKDGKFCVLLSDRACCHFDDGTNVNAVAQNGNV